MPTYKFEAMNASGMEVKDAIFASSAEEAIARIRAKGYFPTKVREKVERDPERGRDPLPLPDPPVSLLSRLSRLLPPMNPRRPLFPAALTPYYMVGMFVLGLVLGLLLAHL